MHLSGGYPPRSKRPSREASRDVRDQEQEQGSMRVAYVNAIHAWPRAARRGHHHQHLAQHAPDPTSAQSSSSST
jgi:hypothetical protein